MIPVRENSEVVKMYPDIWSLTQAVGHGFLMLIEGAAVESGGLSSRSLKV